MLNSVHIAEKTNVVCPKNLKCEKMIILNKLEQKGLQKLSNKSEQLLLWKNKTRKDFIVFCLTVFLNITSPCRMCFLVLIFLQLWLTVNQIFLTDCLTQVLHWQSKD
jgi:hypothetical protein